MLNHCSNSNSQTSDDAVSVELGQMEVGETNPSSGANSAEINSTHDDGNDVGNDQGDKNGDDLDHALAPGIADDDHENRNNTEDPVGEQVINCGSSQVNTDEDDERAAHNGREQLHNSLGAQNLDQDGQDNIQAASSNYAAGRILFTIGRDDSSIHAQEGERGTQEYGNLALGDEVEPQGSNASAEQGNGSGKAHNTLAIAVGQNGNQNGSAEHGEALLQAHDNGLAPAEFLTSIINAGNFSTH